MNSPSATGNRSRCYQNNILALIANHLFDRLIDMTPQVIERIDQFIDQRKADKA